MTEKTAEAKRLIQSVLAERSGKVCVTSSFQAECVVLVHLLTEQRPDIPVLFLETGYHFADTYAYRDRIVSQFGLKLVNLEAKLSVVEQEREFGRLYETAPDRCCAIRKIGPLFAGLEDYDVWFTALRRDQSPSRANLQVVDDFRLPTGKALTKVSPLADWTARDVWAYLKENRIPVLSLYDQGYTSIGCEPCTSLPLDPNNPRSGRWSGQKLECGIHIEAQ
ncbi:MAG TPA: phosphoadenylyl-sulfate reductase [Bryobacteraceae bacterium]|nr:phosphoadenylyl-sulfate reductase [Bryobacteraceae bacterium]